MQSEVLLLPPPVEPPPPFEAPEEPTVPLPAPFGSFSELDAGPSEPSTLPPHAIAMAAATIIAITVLRIMAARVHAADQRALSHLPRETGAVLTPRVSVACRLARGTDSRGAVVLRDQ